MSSFFSSIDYVANKSSNEIKLRAWASKPPQSSFLASNPLASQAKHSRSVGLVVDISAKQSRLSQITTLFGICDLLLVLLLSRGDCTGLSDWTDVLRNLLLELNVGDRR